jgi:hypothetical protein
MIGAREKVIDAQMQVYSVAAFVGEYWLTSLALLSAGLTIWRGDALWLGLAISFGLLGLLHSLRKRISVEAFRVLADTVLVVGALSALGLGSRL